MLEPIRFEEIKFPNRLYKYREWTDDLHKRILTHGEVYFAKPSSFGDHHECVLPEDYESVTSEELERFYYETIPGQLGITEEPLRRAKAKELAVNGPFHDPANRRSTERRHRRNLDKRLGILSLTPHNNIPELWEDFADMHSGFCVGFNSEILFDKGELFASAGPVCYYDDSDPPKTKPLSFSDNERASKMLQSIFSLPSYWSHEEEYRLAKANITDRARSIDPSCIEEVILGARIPNAHADEIAEIVSKTLPNAVLQKASIQSDDTVVIMDV